MNIKSTIGIIAIVISSVSLAEAGQSRHKQEREYGADRSHSRSYETHGKKRHVRQERRHKHWRHANRHNKFRGARHHRKHHYYSRHVKRFNRLKHHNARWNRGWKRGHNERRHYRDNDYRHNSARRSSHEIVVHADPLVPIIVGGIVAKKIAKKIIRHDPIIRTIVRHDPIARALFGH